MKTLIIAAAILSTMAASATDIKLNVKKVISGYYDSVESQLVIKNGDIYAITETGVEWDDEDGDMDTALNITKLPELELVGTEIVHTDSGVVCANIVAKKRKTVIRLTKSCKFKTRTVKVNVIKKDDLDSYYLADVCSFDESDETGLVLYTCENNGEKSIQYSEKKTVTKKYDYFVLEVKN